MQKVNFRSWPKCFMMHRNSKTRYIKNGYSIESRLFNESSKVGGRGKREEDSKDRGQEADGKKGSPTKQKPI